MKQNSISLKPIKDLIGMNFNIPDYQRGYRWTSQQAIDLLNDISAFMTESKDTTEIYCIQPLVIQKKKEKDVLGKIKQATSIKEVEEYLKGTWNVVDGQQRLTTIFLILSYLQNTQLYNISYQTRKDSSDFLLNLNEEKRRENIDYYHIYKVYNTIGEWFATNSSVDKKAFNQTLLEKVCFIWYQVEDLANPIDVFRRLNVGKIPLTDSELIKALFLNRTNFTKDEIAYEHTQFEIANEWDTIEYSLQNDEFWLFIHDNKYSKPTRIDFILDLICENNISKKSNAELKKSIGTDEHRTFRYYYELFNNAETVNEIKDLWSEIKEVYQVFDEWYHDYKLYHYIGYLLYISNKKDVISEYINQWKVSNRDEFEQYLKTQIHNQLHKNKNKNNWIADWKEYVFDIEGHASKSECVKLLLLHNILTIVQQNEKLVSDTKYNLPNFSKFPFHLYKKENWQVEHIRPNSGDRLSDSEIQKAYLLLAKNYLKERADLCSKIDKYIGGDKNINVDDLIEEINAQDSYLTDNDKNKIWNFTLLDESTNKEYGNAIFPIKRMFICNKEQGYKVRYKISGGKVDASDKVPEIAFIPPCTRNVFNKTYTSMPETMVAWTEDDAKAYLKDMEDKIGSFIKGDNNEQ